MRVQPSDSSQAPSSTISPLQALNLVLGSIDAVRNGRAHRLLAVVACVLLLFALLLTGVAALLWAAQLPRFGPWVLGLGVTLGVPLLGLAALVMVGLVGPLAAPAVWCGLSVREVLALLRREVRHRLPQVLLLSAAVSLLSAAVAGLVSFVVLGGGRAVVALAALVTPVDIGAQTFLASLFGQGLRAAAAASSPHASAAVTGAGVVFALGLVLPGVVYLRGLCALYLAVQAVPTPVPALAEAAGTDDPAAADHPDAR